MKRLVDLAQVPCYVIEPEAMKNDYTIILYHGWGSSKEIHVFLGEILSQYGYTIVIPDAPYHGGRQSIITEFFAKKTLEANFWKVIFEAVDEAGALIAASIDAGYAEEDKIIVAGSSMGGCIASGVVTHYAKTVGLISMMGAGAWEHLEEDFRKLDGREALTEVELKQFHNLDPIRKLDHLKGKQVLLLHGKNDQILPPAAQKQFYLQANVVLGDAVSYQEFDQVGHRLSLRMVEEAVSWLQVNFK